MNPFAIDPLEQENQIANAALNPGDIRDDVGFFSGAGSGLYQGLQSAYYRDVFNVASQTGDKQSADRALKNIVKVKPDAAEIGMAGQVLFGFADTIGTAYANFMGGNVTPQLTAIETGLSFQRSREAELIQEGIDPKTAREMASTEGAFQGIGVVAPIGARGNLVTRAASGAAINFGLGAAERGIISKTLMDNGYKDMAEQYRIFDATQGLTDIAIGAFFGGVFGERAGAKPRPMPKPSDMDAILSINNAGHMETSGPGIPTDPATREAHVQSVEKALRDLMEDQPVDVSSTFKSDSMIVNPQTTQHAQSVRAIADEYLDIPQMERNFAESMERLPIEVPNAIVGAESAVKVGREYLPVRWALVDAADVEATMTKADNQYRDRTRASSQAQIAEIANAPDYNLLNASPVMDFGAPTLTRDGKIVGGNGRMAGISAAYDQGTNRSYSEPLLANLDKYGIDPKTADGMKKPVLVRIMETDVDVKRAAIASNEGAGLGMSDLEQAKVDAERMGNAVGLNIDADGNFNTASNMDLIRNMVAQFPITEQGKFVDADGRLSAAGVRRVRNAILYKAYGDSPTLARLVESTDPGAKNVANALLRTAPLVAEVKDGIAAGRYYPLDIAPDIASAVETLDRIRLEKLKVADYLNQAEMFGNELTIEARKVLEFMGEYIRSSKTMGDMITTYYEGVKAAGDPAQVDMLRSEPPTKGELLDAAIAKTGKEFVPELAELPFNEGRMEGAESLPREKQAQLKSLYEKAAEQKNEFDFIGQEVAASVGGRYKAADLKGVARAVEKLTTEYDGDVNGLKDILRATIEVDTPAQALAVVEQLREKFTVLDKGFRNLFAPDAETLSGYRDAKMNIDINGTIAEMQVNVPEMLKIKEARGHDIYKEIRTIEADAKKAGRDLTAAEKKQIMDLQAESEKIYSEAWASLTNRLNSDSEMRAPLLTTDEAGNGRGSGLSQAAQNGSASGSIDTGMPSTSKNFTSLENFMGSPEQNMGADMFSAKAIVTEKPDLAISDGAGGLMLAKDAIAQADENIATAERESIAFNVAAECALVE
jgi:hypothetical protein